MNTGEHILYYFNLEFALDNLLVIPLVFYYYFTYTEMHFSLLFTSTVFSLCLGLSNLPGYSDSLLQLKFITFVVYTQSFLHQVLCHAAHQCDITPSLKNLVGSAIQQSNTIGNDHSIGPLFLQNAKA